MLILVICTIAAVVFAIPIILRQYPVGNVQSWIKVLVLLCSPVVLGAILHDLALIYQKQHSETEVGWVLLYFPAYFSIATLVILIGMELKRRGNKRRP